MEVDASAMTPELQALSQSGQEAFDVVLQDSSTLQALEIVRRVSNKRLVCRGIWHHQPIYAKLFIGEDAKRYALRDKQGVECLAQAHIATPALLYSGSADIAEVLIFHAIENSRNAEIVYYDALNQEVRFQLATKIVCEIAKHHNQNLLQTDLYLKNFLVQGEKIYTLDGDGIHKYTRLSQQQALENLCVLLSKFDVLEIESWLPGLLKTYAEARAWQVAPDAELIKKMTNAHRQKAASHYADKKVFRQCADVAVFKDSQVFTAISSEFLDMDLPKTSQNADSLFTSQNLLKNGNTCTVARVEINHRSIVIKRYNIKSIWHGVNRAFRQTRAAASWANAHRLQLLGVPTAKPVALIEERYLSLGKFGLKGKAYFLCEYIDAPDAAQFFAAGAGKADRAETIKNIITLFYRLYLLRISHGDTKATNVKIVNHQPVLIDLDSMTQHAYASSALKAHARDLHRFMRNWQGDQALYNAFIKTFKVIYADHTPLETAGIL